MIAVKVTYTVKKEYIEANKKMIANFLSDFKSLDREQFLYSVFQKDDEATFIHLSQFNNEQIQQDVLQLPSFLAFQKSRDQNMASEHHFERLNLVGNSKAVL